MQKQRSSKPAVGLPLAPWIFINNFLNTSNVYASALCSLLPQSCVYESCQLLSSTYKGSESPSISIWANSSTAPHEAACRARDCHVKALKRGCNVASVFLCNDSTLYDFLCMDEKNLPINHIAININGTSIEEVAKKIVRWLFSVLSVRETLHLIPEREMLAIDTKCYADYKYCVLKEANMQRKDVKIQFVALIASKPELTEPNKLTWTVVDRSGEAKFYFHHRGPASQQTWDWVLSLKVGDRKILPRMPMVALHEPIAKKIMLSPLRATGATIRGVGHMTMSLGKGVHWVGNKVSVRRSEEQKYMPEADWLEVKEEWKKREKALMKARERQKEKKLRVWENGIVTYEDETSCKDKAGAFKIFNEKGENMWKDIEDDSTSTTEASLVDEKLEKEFC